MPQPRQRIVFCDCLDCVEQPAASDVACASSPTAEAAARQEPPPKCLMFVLSGALVVAAAGVQAADSQAGSSSSSSSQQTVLDGCPGLPHLHRAAAQGSVCLLTLRAHSPADGCSELAQLLSAHEEYQQQALPTSLADRFKGMVSSCASNSCAARDLAASVGMSSSAVLEPETPSAADAASSDGAGAAAGLPGVLGGAAGAGLRRPGTHAPAGGPDVSTQLPDPPEAARRILQELGLQQADAGLDLLLVHLDVDALHSQQQQVLQPPPGLAAAVTAVLGWLDRVLRYLNNSSAFKDAVLLSVLATSGCGRLPATPPLLGAGGSTLLGAIACDQEDAAAATAGSQPSQPQQRQRRVVTKPLQSWEQLEGQPLAVDTRRPILCLRRLPGVIRRDACTRFGLSECCARSGTLGLLADRLLPEIAYKLGRAPKYGA